MIQHNNKQDEWFAWRCQRRRPKHCFISGRLINDGPSNQEPFCGTKNSIPWEANQQLRLSRKNSCPVTRKPAKTFLRNDSTVLCLFADHRREIISRLCEIPSQRKKPSRKFRFITFYATWAHANWSRARWFLPTFNLIFTENERTNEEWTRKKVVCVMHMLMLIRRAALKATTNPYKSLECVWAMSWILANIKGLRHLCVNIIIRSLDREPSRCDAKRFRAVKSICKWSRSRGGNWKLMETGFETFHFNYPLIKKKRLWNKVAQTVNDILSSRKI